jgi:F-type H+-transporting ATPase subunit a
MFNAYLGLLPFFGSITVNTAEGTVHIFRPANTDINVPLALALISSFMTWYLGFKLHGFRYLSQFFQFGPFFSDLGKMITGKIKFSGMKLFNGAIGIFVGLLELLSQLIRVLSLTFRLFGNMTAGEILLLLMTFLVPFLVSDIFYGLELLIGFVQALVFGGLTLVYLTMASASHTEEHQAEQH